MKTVYSKIQNNIKILGIMSLVTQRNNFWTMTSAFDPLMICQFHFYFSFLICIARIGASGRLFWGLYLNIQRM